MSTRIARLKEYAKPTSGPAGASTEKNIGYWSSRASDNSGAPRAKGKTSTNGKPEACLDEPKLPSTGEMSIHDTGSRRGGDARAKAKADKNYVSTAEAPFMRNVRRGES